MHGVLGHLCADMLSRAIWTSSRMWRLIEHVETQLCIYIDHKVYKVFILIKLIIM